SPSSTANFRSPRPIEARLPQVPWLRAMAHPGNFKIYPRGNPTAVASRNRATAGMSLATGG
ncbi:MAG TPA: hypothetical protein VI009_00160, partial [Xanthobacteraceae bacterium]